MLIEATGQSCSGSDHVARGNRDGAAELAVRIRYRGYRCFHVTGRMVSAEGMLLVTRSLRIPENTQLHLIFEIDGRACHVPAIVVDNSPDGIEVIFRTAQPEIEQAFERQRP